MLKPALSPEQQMLYNEIDKILWEDWDPIGVNDCEGARDEYSSYVPQIYRLIFEDEDTEKMSATLILSEKLLVSMEA